MNIEVGNAENPAETEEQISQRIQNELSELGFPECPEELVQRLLFIEQHSPFNQDARMVCEGLENVLEIIEGKNQSAVKLSEKQKKEGELAAYLHDIGKSSSSSEINCQLAVIKLFSAENIQNEEQTVSEIVRANFPDEYDQMMSLLVELDISDGTTMRIFWNKHAFWTRNILDRYSDVIPERVRLIAASHHIDHDINPYNIEEDIIPNETRIIGSLEYYVEVLEERALMAIDQYQAAMFRGKVTHEKAMGYLRKSFQKYNDDPVMNSIINAIDELGSQNMLFPKTAGRKFSKKV